MEKVKVGILTFSDGRKYIHEDLLELNLRYQRKLAMALEKTDLVEVVQGENVIWNNHIAAAEGRRLLREGCDLTIFNYAIWCYPHLSAIAANFAPGPYILFGNLHPSEPGMVGMLAAAGTMDQLGHQYTRVWGDISQRDVFDKVLGYIKAAGAVKRLRGMTYGLFGGRPLGMYTAVSNLDQWQSIFGIDVEHVEQEDLVRYAMKENPKKVDNALKWLEKNVGHIAYDGKGLTPEKLKLQIRSYYAFRKIIDERRLDFVGTKAHGDLTETFVTMDIAEAFLNDPYDWDGPHKPIVASTEADMDGALTMQIFKLITGEPVLFSDVRHYEAKDDVWYFSNSGTHATYFAGKSYDPVKNLRKVSFFPEASYYPAGGASVHHFAAPGEATFARLARRKGTYYLTIVPGKIVKFSEDVMRRKGSTVTPEWPIAFTKVACSAEEFLTKFPCNHIHGCYGNWTRELVNVAKILGMEAVVLN